MAVEKGRGVSDFQLYHGDCLEILPTLPAGSVDAIIGDIPYGTTACSWDVVIPFAPMWECVEHVLKPRGVFVTTASQPFTSMLVMSKLEWFKYEWVWEKRTATNIFQTEYAPMKIHESIPVFCSGVPKFNGIRIPRSASGKTRVPYGHKPSNTGKREFIGGFVQTKTIFYDKSTKNPISIIYCANETGLHPTQKPVALYEYLIRTYTDVGDIILDITMGSGTTGVACHLTGRNFIGIEIDETYFKIAEQRIKKAQQQTVMNL